MKKIVFTFLVLLSTVTFADQYDQFEVWGGDADQTNPDVDGKVIVWQEDYGDEITSNWNVYGMDYSNSENPQSLTISDGINRNETNPVVKGPFIAWQDDYYGDWDIRLLDRRDPDNSDVYLIAYTYSDETYPSLDGSTLVYQKEYTDSDTGASDWDIMGADITDPNNAIQYPIAYFYDNQQKPAITKTQVGWEDDRDGILQISGLDIWDRNNMPASETIELQFECVNLAADDKMIVWQANYPQGGSDIWAALLSDDEEPDVFPITQDAALQQNPDVSGQIVVWADNRNGQWDIYGYNLITRNLFQITFDDANQTNPAISGNLVAWEDDYFGPKNIWARYLNETQMAYCYDKLDADLDYNCRVDLEDFAIMAGEWMECYLSPSELCFQ